MNVEVVRPQPDDEDHRPPSRRTVIGVVVLMGLVVLLVWTWGPLGDRIPVPAASPASTMPPTTTSTSTTSTALTPPTRDVPELPSSYVTTGSPLAEFVPGLTGQLVTLQGQGSMLLITRDADLPEKIVTGTQGAWPRAASFDADSVLIGATVSSTGGDRLYLGDETGLADTNLLVTSYAWHQTLPAEVAVVLIGSPDGPQSLATFEFDPSTQQLSRPTYVTQFASDRYLRAWSESGFVVGGYDVGSDSWFVEFVDPNGDVLWRFPGVVVAVSADGSILIGESVDDSWILHVARSDGVAGDSLDWAPTQFNAVRWSPTGQMIAFVGQSGTGATDWGLHIYASDGTLLHSEMMPWRVWDVQWSPNDRYIVLPGTDNQGTHGVVFYDTDTSTLSVVDDFQDFVQWSDLRD